MKKVLCEKTHIEKIMTIECIFCNFIDTCDLKAMLNKDALVII